MKLYVLKKNKSVVEDILAIVAISLAMDTKSFSWAVKVSLAHSADKMVAQKIIVRSLSAWEKIGAGAVTMNVVDENNTLTISRVEASNFLFVPHFVGTKETPTLISPKILGLVQQGIGLNTKGIPYRVVRTRKIEFSGSPFERAILSQAALELDMDWERLNQECKILKVEGLEMEGIGVWMQKDDDTFHLHVRGPAEMILKVCSGFYDVSGYLNFLNENMRNLFEGKLRRMNGGSIVQVVALAHRQVSEEESRNDQDLIGRECGLSLLGFLALKEINQAHILEEVLEECINARVGFNLVISENSVNGAAEHGIPESNQGLKDETSAEGMNSGEDDVSVSMYRRGEDTAENSSDIAILDRKSGSVSIDQLKVAKFCLVEEFTGSEALTSTSQVVVELLKKGIGTNTTDNDNFPGSPIEKAVLSWAIHELKLDLEELEKKISICRSENFNPENQGMGFLMSLENGTLHVHKKGPVDYILKMCSSYYCNSGEKKLLVDNERLMLEQKVKGLESCKYHWVAFVHSQISQDTTQECWTLLGILILDQILAPENGDDGVVLEPIHDATSDRDSTVEDEVAASSEEKLLVSMRIEGDETKRRSDIVILDGNYSSLILILRWANCVLHNTQMFLQFQLTTCISSVLNTYLSTVSLSDTPGVGAGLMYVLVQLIWVNLGMGLFAALTFGRQKPQPASSYLMRKRVDKGRKWQIVTGLMWRNIMAQVVCQVLVISILQFKSPVIFGIRDEAKDTATFVMPMFLQAFNIINAGNIEEKNIFAGIRPSLIWLVAILIAVSFVIAEILVHFVGFVALDWKQWTICIGIAMVSWPVGFAVRFLPVHFFVSPLMAVVNKLKAYC